ncbi:MAG: pirin family protein [Sedimenticola sp.]|nr:pirin family protein [Sedimenticola sp.]
MQQIRRATERGRGQLDWLESYHSFSFANYYDPAHRGVSILRVINDDRIAPSSGFDTHSHRDMEIVTYVLEGELEHKDSLGNGSVIRPGDVQRMSAGRGVLHSEFNPSDDRTVHLLQIWLLPNKRGVEPGYAQQHFPVSERQGKLRLLVSPDGRDHSISAHQDGLLYGTLLNSEESVGYRLSAERMAYVHVARGEATVNGETLKAGDAITLKDETPVQLDGIDQAEILLFDLPGQ